MGLLGNGPDDPRSAAIMALSAGLLQGNFGGGLLGANNAFSQHKEQALKARMMEMQMAQMQAEADQRRAAAEQAQRRQEALPNLFGGGMSPGAFSPSADGRGPVMPQSAAPTPSLNWQAALRAGFKPEEIEKMANLPNAGRSKVARTIETVDAQGRPVTIQLDEFGQRIGDGMGQWKAPVFQNLGDKTVALDPVSMQQRAAFAQGQSPDSRASNAVQWANHGLSKERLALERDNAQAGKVPAGYRPAAGGGLEFIPGGPADPAAARRAAPTEFQGKAGMFGNRAAEADRIITGLQGKYSPAAVNTKLAADNAPWYLGGGVTGAAANLVTSKESQMAEQAQRDFVNAVLRLESGAAVAESEFNNARKQYFPQPGDSGAVIAQKAANRKRAIQGLMDNSRGTAPQAPQPQQSGATGSFDNDPLGLRK